MDEELLTGTGVPAFAGIFQDICDVSVQYLHVIEEWVSVI